MLIVIKNPIIGKIRSQNYLAARHSLLSDFISLYFTKNALLPHTYTPELISIKGVKNIHQNNVKNKFKI